MKKFSWIILILLVIGGGYWYIYSDWNNTLTRDDLMEIRESELKIAFLAGSDENMILNLKNELEAKTEIKSLAYISPEIGLKEFKERHKNDEVISEQLNSLEENPVGAEMTITLKDSKDKEGIISWIKSKKEYSLIETIVE